MHTAIFVILSIPPFPDLSSTSGNLATQTSNQSKCGGDFVGHGPPDMKSFWTKGSSSSGSTTSMSRIGAFMHVITPKASKLTEHRNRLVFRWLAIPWLQKEVDSYVRIHNTTRRRANRHKVLPNGIPDGMFHNPETVNALDFKVSNCLDPKLYIHLNCL